jgi:RHS repeat-associated protein
LSEPRNRTKYTYDSAGRPSDAVDTTNSINYAVGPCANGATSPSTGACYAPQGAVSQLQNGSNLVSTYQYNARLQPCWIYGTSGTALATNTACTAADPGPANILDLKYNFNLGIANNGKVLGITNNKDTTRSESFAYDALNRILTGETTSTYSSSPSHCWGEAYVYDNQNSGGGAWGNLTNINVASTSYNGCTQESLSATANAQNRLSTNGYDTAGNATSYGTATYSYNAENQMTQSVASSTAGYVYDGYGDRVEKTSGGQVTKIYWYGGSNNALDETDGTGSFTNTNFNEYVFFGGGRIARRNSSNNFYYLADQLGTSRGIVQAGQTSPCYDADFYPFGGERPYTTTCTQNYKFTGKERDSESNLDNFGPRYNSSQMGRFMSPDPLGDFVANPTNPQTWNMYSYVLNNPLSLVDPTGYDACYWYDGTHDDDPADGGSTQQECSDQGGIWIPTLNQSITVNGDTGESDYSTDIWITDDLTQPQQQEQSYAQCVKQGGNATSVQHGLQWASGGRLGNGWLSGTLFGNPFSGAIQFEQDISGHNWGGAGSGGSSLGAGFGAGPAAETAANNVPNINIAVTASVAAQASVATASSQTIVNASAEATAVLPVGQMAQSALSLAGKGLGKLGNMLVLPVSITGTLFSATVCSIGR